LIWLYARAHDELRCEVRPEGGGFNIVVQNADRTEITHFEDATSAAQGQLAIEHRLLASGWRLKEFHPSATGGLT
jgi:hypothetical protein